MDERLKSLKIPWAVGRDIVGLLGRLGLCSLLAALPSMILGYSVPSYQAANDLFIIFTFYFWGALSLRADFRTFSIIALLFWVFQFIILPFDIDFFYLLLAAFIGRFLKEKGTVFCIIAITLVTGFILTTSVKDGCFYGCASTQNSAIAKEAASMISGSYTAYGIDHKPTAKMPPEDLLRFMNYVKIDTLTQYEGGSLPPKRNYWESFRDSIRKLQGKYFVTGSYKGGELQQCSEQLPCIVLHNGGILQFDKAQTFGGTATTNSIFFNLDPDGNNPMGRTSIYLYFNGRIKTGESKWPGTVTNGTITSQDKDPDYIQNWN